MPARDRHLMPLPRVLLALAACALLLSACATPPIPPPALQDIDRQLRAGTAHYEGGRLADAATAFRRAATAAERVDDAHRRTAALLALGSSELLQERFANADQTYRLAADEASTHGLAVAHAQAAAGLGEIARQQGRLDDAATVLQGVLTTPGLPADTRTLIENALALTRLAQGDIAVAEALLTEADTRSRMLAPELRATTLANRARALLARATPGEPTAPSHLAAAQRLGAEALDIDRARLHPPAIAADHLLLGDIAARNGDIPEARRHFARARAIFAQTGQTAAVARTDTRLRRLP